MNKRSKKVLGKLAVSGLLGGSAGGVVFSTLYAIGSQLPSKPMKILWAVGSFVAGELVAMKSSMMIMELIYDTEDIIEMVKDRVSEQPSEKEA